MYSEVDYEQIGLAAFIPYIITSRACKVVIYGASASGFEKLVWLRRNGIEPIYMVDRDENKKNTIFFGVTVIHPDDLKDKICSQSVTAIIGTAYWHNPYEQNSIAKTLYSAGVEDIFDFSTGCFRFRYWAHYFAVNSKQFHGLYDRLADEASKEVLVEYVRMVMQDDFYRGKISKSITKYMADDVYAWQDDECIITCGMCRGDTIFNIFSRKSFKKIYGIEADNKTFGEARAFISLLPEDTYNKIEVFNKGISSVDSLDNLLENKPVSLFCIDVEGAELELLRGAERIIKNQLPVLAVSVYHKKEDLIDIPAFITSLSEQYTFYLRKYSCGPSPSLTSCELILYAVPSHRCIDYRS